MFDDLKMFARYAWELKGFLQHQLTPEQCHQMLARQLETRDESFLRILERGIYANPRSPYRKLLRHAGAEFTDVAGLVHRHGVEGALSKLYEASPWPAVSFLCL